MKTYYCVTTTFDDRGRVTSAITDTRVAETKPDSTMTEAKRADIYNDWYGSRKEALNAVQEAKKA